MFGFKSVFAVITLVTNLDVWPISECPKSDPNSRNENCEISDQSRPGNNEINVTEKITVPVHNRMYKCVTIRERKLIALIDTGSQINVISSLV